MEIASPIPVPNPYLPKTILCPDTDDIIITHQVSGVDKKTYSKFTSEYDLGTEKVIGTGAFGVVVRCKNVIDEQYYAIKKISIGARSDYDKYSKYKDLSREASIFATFDHPNIVRYHTTWIECTFVGSTGGEDIDITKPCIYIQQELCDSTLEEMMPAKKLSKEDCAYIFSEVVEGLQYIHSFNIMHGDLGLGNVFFCKGQLKIGDFGLSRIIGDANKDIVVRSDPPIYAAPDTCVSAAADVYSLGIMLVELLLNISTYTEASEKLPKLKKDEPEFPANFPDGTVKTWVTKMIKSNPSDRPSSAEILDSIEEIKKAIKALIV